MDVLQFINLGISILALLFSIIAAIANYNYTKKTYFASKIPQLKPRISVDIYRSDPNRNPWEIQFYVLFF